MKRRRVSCLAIFLLSTFVLCLVVTGFFSLYYLIPQRAAQIFGSPHPELNPTDRIYLSAMLLRQSEDLTTPLDPLGMSRLFQVDHGEPTNNLIFRLETEGLVADGEAFRQYLIYKGLDTSIQAGKYNLSPAMTAQQIALELQDATPSQVNFNILPGWRIEEIAAALPTSGLKFTPEEFLAAARNPGGNHGLLTSLPAVVTLEGFFFPDEYQYARETSVNQFIETILANFQMKMTPDIQQGFNRQGLNIYEGVVLASIVEREAVGDEEMPLIASVFINRLGIGMELASDPTVQYALGYNTTQNTWWTNPLTLEDLQINSPYNTYLYPGLPPSPIANPGLTALRAVAFPAQSPYYYFRATCDGTGRHVFAETLEEHIANACQ